MKGKSGFENLSVWQKSMLLALQVYSLCKKFPKDETYGIVSQIRRAAISIPSNIAEGAERNSKKEFVQFLSIAKGSCSELKTQIILSYKVGYIEEKDYNLIMETINEVNYFLLRLRDSMKKD